MHKICGCNHSKDRLRESCTDFAVFVVTGQELRHDSWTLPHEARNRAVLNAMASPEPNLYTLSPAEYRPYYEEVAFAWLLSQAVSGHVFQASCQQ